MNIDRAFRNAFPNAQYAYEWVRALEDLLPIIRINNVERTACFLAQCGHECQGFTIFEENLNYSAKALLTVFKKYFKSVDEAQAYARQPEKIANKVYANRLGNGDEASGDGWKYRGRGCIQITGKDNYKRCGNWLSVDLVANPLLISNINYRLKTALWFWDSNNLNAYCDNHDFKGLTKRINGGLNGYTERLALYEKIINLL